MKSWLKYIILSLGLVLYIEMGIEQHATTMESASIPTTTEATLEAPDINTPNSQLCNQRSSHLEILLRIPNHSRRVDTESRYNTVYLKAGKIVNTGTYFYTHNLSKHFHLSLSESIHRLICLGRLII